MELQIQSNFQEILERPDDFPEGVVAAGLDSIKKLASQIFEAKKRLEGNLIRRMVFDDATKLSFIDADGVAQDLTLSKGTMKADKSLEGFYMGAGFDPNEIGDYVFRASWSKAKQAMKYGGAKKEIIEKYFIEGSKSLKVTK